jgi:hypothetical protein
MNLHHTVNAFVSLSNLIGSFVYAGVYDYCTVSGTNALWTYVELLIGLTYP